MKCQKHPQLCDPELESCVGTQAPRSCTHAKRARFLHAARLCRGRAPASPSRVSCKNQNDPTLALCHAPTDLTPELTGKGGSLGTLRRLLLLSGAQGRKALGYVDERLRESWHPFPTTPPHPQLPLERVHCHEHLVSSTGSVSTQMVPLWGRDYSLPFHLQ